METIFTLILFLLSQFFGIDLEGVDVSESGQTAVTEVAEVIRVIDGDTIEVNLDGNEETVRYIGIDTPEPYRDGEPACYSAQASDRNSELVSGKEVRLVPDSENRDRYDRLLRYVYVDEVFVNQTLVQEGYATTLTIKPNTQFQSQLKNAETAARTAGVGMWSACTDQEFTQPDPEATETTVIESSQLSSGQQRLLEFLGIDPGTFTVTADMIACANESVGITRLAEITTGDVPTIAEGIKLIGCYQS